MENETEYEIREEPTLPEPKKTNNKYTPLIVIAVVVVAIAGVIFYLFEKNALRTSITMNSDSPNEQVALIDGGHILPLETEKKILATLRANGAIDQNKLSRVTELNLLWAFGLANKNPVLENGPIMDTQYGGPINMASVGGWTVATGLVMNHYDRHAFVTLTPDKQVLVEKIAKGIYRPCCDNSTYFPDCNHGMAMLGLLEYLASTGATEDQMWNAAITANTNWFPDQYQTIAQYLKQKGTDIKNIIPRELLSAEYSSRSGFARISSQVIVPQREQNSGGCSV